jgi:hypothetical protein
MNGFITYKYQLFVAENGHDFHLSVNQLFSHFLYSVAILLENMKNMIPRIVIMMALCTMSAGDAQIKMTNLLHFPQPTLLSRGLCSVLEFTFNATLTTGVCCVPDSLIMGSPVPRIIEANATTGMLVAVEPTKPPVLAHKDIQMTPSKVVQAMPEPQKALGNLLF